VKLVTALSIRAKSSAVAPPALGSHGFQAPDRASYPAAGMGVLPPVACAPV